MGVLSPPKGNPNFAISPHWSNCEAQTSSPRRLKWHCFITSLCRHPAPGPIEILRDPWGIPHIFAETDVGAYYGLGYATAEDRAFQMTYGLRIIQGRLAEVVGEIRMLNRNETSIDHDRKMRTFGFHRAALRTAANLDAESRALLEAYCDGVNAWFRDHQNELHPLFAQTGLRTKHGHRPTAWRPGGTWGNSSPPTELAI